MISGYTFAARSYAYDVRHLSTMIVQAIQHKGLAFVECLQPCPTYNNITTKDWYAGEDRKDANGNPQSRLYKLEETGFDPVVREWQEDWQKKAAAMQKAQEWGDHIPIGIFYKKEYESTFEDRIANRIPFYRERPPAKQKLKNEKGLSTVDLSEFLAGLRTS